MLAGPASPSYWLGVGLVSWEITHKQHTTAVPQPQNPRDTAMPRGDFPEPWVEHPVEWAAAVLSFTNCKTMQKRWRVSRNSCSGGCREAATWKRWPCTWRPRGARAAGAARCHQCVSLLRRLKEQRETVTSCEASGRPSRHFLTGARSVWLDRGSKARGPRLSATLSGPKSSHDQRPRDSPLTPSHEETHGKIEDGVQSFYNRSIL